MTKHNPTQNVNILLSKSDYLTMTEGAILEFLIAEYRRRHPEEKPRVVLASLIDKSPQYLDKCINDETHLSAIDRIRIEDFLNVRCFSDHYKALREKYDQMRRNV